MLTLLLLAASAAPPDPPAEAPPAEAPNAAFVSPFEPPVLIEADGTPIDTGPQWGHSSPATADLDDDGLDDLVVGDFSGYFSVYRNAGTAAEPRYEAADKIEAGGEYANVRIYCCIGAQARFADLDGDGRRDLVANSYDPGHCYLFRGLPSDGTGGGGFAAREEVIDVAGVPVRSAPKQRQDVESFGSFFTPVDWDADGDRDLLIGCFDGTLKVRLNEGTPEEHRFAAENVDVTLHGETDGDGQPLKVKAHLCPDVADWDGDGRWDLVVGSDDGSVVWFRNVGTADAPQFEAARPLVPAAPDSGYNRPDWGSEPPAPGIRSQVAATDVDADGDLDLIVGDFYTAYEFREDLSPEERAQAEDLLGGSSEAGKAFGEAMEQLRADFMRRYPGDEVYSDEATEAWSKEYRVLKDGPLYEAVEQAEAEFAKAVRPLLRGNPRGDRSFDLAKSHGHVWLYRRK